jgi:molecular chaperone GrpE
MKKHDDKTSQSDNKHEDLVRELEETKKQVDDLKNKYLRALADYQNLERRTQEDRDQTRIRASEFIIQRLLPVVDTFKRASEHIKDVGLDLAFKELAAVLDEQGVTRLDVVGKPFNPHEMECVEVVAGEDGIVQEEALPGYRIRDRVLRVAQVKVGKK